MTSKLTGVSFHKSILKDISIVESNASYVDFSDAIISNTQFIDTKMIDSVFTNSTLKNVIFDNVDLSKTDFTYVEHDKIDLSTSRIDSVRFDLKSLKGLTVSNEGAVIITEMLGVKVK